MPATPIPSPILAQEEAYRWLVARLRADAFLRDTVRTWRTGLDGEAQDDDPPTADQCPWVRLLPVCDPPAPFCTTATRLYHRADLTVRVETVVRAYAPLDSIRLANAFHQAVFGAETYADFLADAGSEARISSITWVGVPAAAEPPAVGVGLVAASMDAFRLELYV